MLPSVRSNLCNYDLYCKLCLNLHVGVILNMLHQLGLPVPCRLSISRVISVKSDPLRLAGLPSVKFDLLLS
jgi:hypothetical protein